VVGAAIVTGSLEDFALDGFNESFAGCRVYGDKPIIFNRNEPISGLA
jgi:hypothetical protein